MDQTLPAHDENPIEIPKPELEEPKSSRWVWLKSLGSLGFFLVIGYFFFRRFTGDSYSALAEVIVLTVVVVFHEFGHFVAMKIYKYRELGMFFIPLLGAYVSGKKQEVSQKQSAIILLAGPVPGIFLGIILHFLSIQFDLDFLNTVAWILIFLNVLNLLPVYPLDGGQLLHRLFLDDYNILGKIFVVLSVVLMSWVAISSGYLFLLLFPFMMISKMIGDVQHERIEKKIEAEGIDLMKSYEELTADEYWKIRNAVIKHYPQFKDVNPSPPYDISSKEDQIITTIQGLLQRSLIQDLSLTGKFLILVIWIGFFVAPFLIKNPFIYF
ncbi:MAG TPA: site-2 protease family protein [Chitinophagaceae bacterium]|jgi:Zn-dependent protease|nr:site-2 protease family protein [Chitinophagaceae bacterium]